MQAGSSIMPGKVNPVICEAVAQAAIVVTSNDFAITMAAQSGQLELNAFMPLIAQCLLENISLLIAADSMFRQRCIRASRLTRARAQSM